MCGQLAELWFFLGALVEQMRYFCYTERIMRYHHTLSLCTALCLVPGGALAAQLTAQDTIAGLQAEIVMSGLGAGETVTVFVYPPDSDAVEQTVRTDATGRALAVVSGSDTERSGPYTVQIETLSNQLETVFDVLPDRLSTEISSVRALSTSIDADGTDTSLIDVTLRDRFGNPLPDRPVTLIPSRTEDIAEPLSDVTDEDGVQRFALTTTVPGTLTVRAMDLLSGMILEESADIVAGGMGNSDPWSTLRAQLTTGEDTVDRFELIVPKAMEAGKEASKITVRAVDARGNTVDTYEGTVKFRSSDKAATLPNFGSYTFKARDLGRKEFALVLKFKTTGTQTLHVEDADDPSISGDASITVTGSSAPQNQDTILITAPKEGQVFGSDEVKVEGTGPALINLIVQAGTRTIRGDTDEDGRFSITVPIDETKEEMTIVVTDDQDRFTSAPVKIRVDASTPTADMTFTPASPETGQQTLVVVRSEAKLRSVTMALSKAGVTVGSKTPLLENVSAAGSYQAFFTAPEPGTYQPVIEATDAVGNVGRYIGSLTVQPRALPIVKGLRGEAKADSVQLQWNEVEADIDGYRIYVGENENDFLYKLETGTPQTRAVVRGLQPGHRYVFAVTAIKDERESSERSNALSVDTLGLKLTVIPQDSALELQWEGLPQSLTLQSYLLEYGVVEGSYTEKRILNPEAQAYIMRDLLNGVEYALKLTPITVTAERRDDIAVTAKATPNGTGFTQGPSDPIPDDLQVANNDEPLIDDMHPGAGDEGLIPVGFAGNLSLPAVGLSALLIGGYLYRRHRMQQTKAFLEALAQSRNS